MTSQFRLVCATNRDLPELVKAGRFRADLYFRITEWIVRPPPLRNRREDILLLAKHFISEAHPEWSDIHFTPAVADYLMSRDYPGNVRDLRQLVRRLGDRHIGKGGIGIGDIEPTELPDLDCDDARDASSARPALEAGVAAALQAGLGLKEIGRMAQDMAIRLAIADANGNLQRAAQRLGVTDRALQLRRANSASEN